MVKNSDASEDEVFGTKKEKFNLLWKRIRDEQYDTRISDTTDTNTYSIDTWLLESSIRYLAHVM